MPLKYRLFLDKSAIGLSLLCSVHCIVLPTLLVLAPNMVVLHLESEAFHLGMILLVVPTSIYALTKGCKQHHELKLLIMGGVGILFLLMAVMFHGVLVDEFGAKILTVIGSALIALAHYKNYRLCGHNQDCAYPGH